MIVPVVTARSEQTSLEAGTKPFSATEEAASRAAVMTPHDEDKHG